ncbi:MAG TPA: hypothetical protein VG866_00325 [Candidatus Paceibacterota bacterium]|nr:hypothetical protein [Candidatus Paceibacterota bacterium]
MSKMGTKRSWIKDAARVSVSKGKARRNLLVERQIKGKPDTAGKRKNKQR